MVDGFSTALAPVIPLLMKEFGLSYTGGGALISLFWLTGALLQAPMGFAGRKVSSRTLIGIGLLWTSVFIILTGFASHYDQILVLLVLAGIGQSTFHPYSSALISRIFDIRRRGRALSVNLFGGKAGMFVSTGLVSILIATVNWRMALQVWAFLGIAVATSFLLILRNDRVSGTISKTVHRAPVLTWRIVALTTAYIVYNMNHRGLTAFVPILLVSTGSVSVPEAGALVSLLLLGGAFGELSGGFLADRFGRRMAIAGPMMASALLIHLLVSNGRIGPLGVILALTGLLTFMTAPAIQAHVADLTSAEQRSSIFGLLFTLGIGVGSLSPAIMGIIGDRAGLSAAFYFLVLTNLVGVASAMLLRRTPAI